MNSRSFIAKECENQNWEGIITRIWPNTKYLYVIVTEFTTPSHGPSKRGSGKKYELVITTYPGICRYSVGDVLQVTGENVLLSIDSDTSCKTRLIELLQFCACTIWSSTLVMLTLKTIPGHYAIYCKLLIKDPTISTSHEVLNQCCGRMFELGLSTVPSCR
ncbi:hypothetical protein H5410_006555 [Solanum commersonii]|uniref:GH3 middle domain-containing protein n=1 Tax=Solanum commersonii TaxID=4109 RepID=A0A9J6AA39_SOLCO|nr:hypothetical protein H5410_006555 [Solanum commersonii]